MTLNAIAERAGVSVQTVIRRYGTKEGLIEAAIAEGASGIPAHRDTAPVGDISGALDVLLEHYERDGDSTLRTQEAEGHSEAARLIVTEGRRYHREWCARVFAPGLPPPSDPDHIVRLDAFVATTDLYLWKLLRRDLGRSLESTRATLLSLLKGLTQPPST
jgi:AcrR family transcriptional regulator